MHKKAQEHYLSLSDQQRIEFLSRFIYHLSEVARGSYPGAGTSEEAAIGGMRAFNEVVQVVSKQLLVALGIWGIRDAYPQDVFVDLIFRISQQGHVQGDFSWAFKKSLGDVGIQDADM
jgi:hypothetical protein